MNFSNARNHFSSFMKNLSKNKNSLKYFNSSINSKKSLINFSNNFTNSSFLTLSRMISTVKYSALLKVNTIQTDTESSSTAIAESQNNQTVLLDIKTLFWNELCLIKNSI